MDKKQNFDTLVEKAMDTTDYITNNLYDFIHKGTFKEEMSRFIPTNIQANTLKSVKFLDCLTNELNELLLHVKHSIKKSNNHL